MPDEILETNSGEDISPQLMTFTDEDGNEHNFELLDTVEIDDDFYYALVPFVDQQALENGDGELVILKGELDEDQNEEFFTPIEDDEEYNKIAHIFLERLEDLYEIEGSELE